MVTGLVLGLVAAVAVGALAVAVVAIRRQRAGVDQRVVLERSLERERVRAGSATAAQVKLTRALDAIPQGVVIGDATGDVTYRNAAAGEWPIARHGEALVEGVIRELLTDAVAGQSGARAVELFGPPRRVVEVTAIPLTGAAGGALVVVDDISERRRLDAVRRDFVANISHELRTPVGAIGLLAETIGGEDDVDVVHRLAGRMVAESFRVARTIDDLLELSRIEARERPVREPVPVHLVMAEASDRIRPAAELRGITISVLEPARRLSVLGDRRQLVSAVYNLLDNAVKYSDPGSSVELWAATDGRWVELAVQDHGLGIPPHDLERVFERFYRVDRARSRETGGTGLGLAIVRHVVANHDGDVRVESREGVGSTFTLRVPAGPGPVAVALPTPEGVAS